MIEFAAKKEWTAAKEKAAVILSSALQIEPATAHLLVLRGIETADEAQRFLNPSAHDMHDPFLFASMRGVMQRLDQALTSKQKITVYSDYDVDGTTAAAILYLYLKSFGADIHIYTPHRQKEGYGLNLDAIKKISSDGTRLIITVDCGITNVAEVALAKEQGLDVIVTDHHECPEILPPADFIVNPKQPGCAYPFRYLCGAGIALKLVEAHAGREKALLYADLAALGTIADIVPLLGENRVIATLGLQQIRENAHAGIRMLAEAAAIPIKTIDSRSVSFGLAPRINAASRMDDAKLALTLLTSVEENDEAKGIAATLCDYNKTRQQIEEKILQSAYHMAENIDLMDEWAVLLADDEWNTGVTGIVCSQLCEDLYRPVILFGAEGENYVGSARSTDEINIFEALSQCQDLFVRFGGHSRAAGLTIKKENLPLLRKKLNDYLKSTYTESNIIKKHYYDIPIGLKDASKKLIGELERFLPLGQDNPSAVFYVSQANVKSHTFMGKIKKDHLRLVLEEKETLCNAVCFYHTKKYCYVSPQNEYIGSISVNDYDKAVQILIQAIRPKITNDTVQAYMQYLKNDFTLSFVNEIRACRWDEPVDEDFEEKLNEALQKSRFGTLILFNTNEGLQRALKLKPVIEAMAKNRLDIPCAAERAYMPYNMLKGINGMDDAMMNKYGNVFLVGAFAYPTTDIAFRLFDQDLQIAYRLRAKQYYMDRPALLRCYSNLQSALEKKVLNNGDDVEKLCRALGMKLENAIFAMHVFSELGLIDAYNHGKIQFKTDSTSIKKDLKDSGTYMSFLNAVR
jgi:single-stranded-DNA-specific exonuclease